MDYSLLIAIETNDVDPIYVSDVGSMIPDPLFIPSFKRKYKRVEMVSSLVSPSFFSVALSNLNQNYHFGIIDYLQSWNLQKKSERLSKSLLHRNIYQNRWILVSTTN